MSTLLSVLVDVFIVTFDKSMLESLIDFISSPRIFLFGGDNASTSGFDSIESFLLLLSVVNKLLNVVSTFRFVKDDAIEQDSELWIDFIVNWDLTGVNDSHVHTILDSMVKEHSVHSISQLVEPSESETQV